MTKRDKSPLHNHASKQREQETLPKAADTLM